MRILRTPLTLLFSSALVLVGLLLFCGTLLSPTPSVKALSSDEHGIATNVTASQERTRQTRQGNSEICENVTATTVNECLALTALYTSTTGPAWINQTNWDQQSPSFPCDWYGVQCDSGHVTQLLLAGNRLSGTLPIAIGRLSELTALQLENNSLHGRIPAALCALQPTLSEADFANNALLTPYKRVQNCLAKIDPDWSATQTWPVRDLTVTELYTTSLRLSWQPTGYAVHGYYEVYWSTRFNGPFTLHGTTADKQSDSYVVTGLLPGTSYFFQVIAYTPPHDAQMNEVRGKVTVTAGVTKATMGNVLVAAYFPADNDLASQINYVIQRFRRGTQFNPNVTVVMLVDGLGDANTRVVTIANGTVSATTAVEDAWNRKELDTSDPAVLAWFLRYARSNYPATKTVVSLLGHGLAMAPEIDWPDAAVAATAHANRSPISGEIPALPQEWDDTPSDVTNNSYMSATDVGEALMAATDNGANPFDLLFFDQCFQGNLDALYEVYQTAEVFVASPNYAWLAAAYDQYIIGFTPTATSTEMAQVIINRYEARLNNHHPNAILAIRGSDIPPIANAISALGDALTAVVNAGQHERIANAVIQSNYVDTTQCGRQNLKLQPPDELIGIEGFAKQLFAEFSNDDGHGVLPALEQLRIAMEPVFNRTRSGHPYLDPLEYWDYQDTLTILAPLPRNAPSNVAWRASIYRPDAPFSATWTLDPMQPITVTKSLAYTKAGRWDDFLATWFQSLEPTVGQWCNYMPPEQVVIEDAEPLSLTLTLDDVNALSLDWTPTDDESATEYLLYLDGPYDISWELTDTTALTQTTAQFPALSPGAYKLRVLARNDDNEFVAQSNAASIEIPDVLSPTNTQIFLPFVSR